MGGALGALARYAVDGLISHRSGGGFPWGTLLVNITGTFVLGFLFTVLTERLTVAVWFRSALLIGFLGAYTTFSTLSLETFRLLEDGSLILAVANLGGSLVAGMVAVYGGVVAGRVI